MKVVAVLKLIRAAHGVNAMNLLCRSGLFIDCGAIIRCVNDCMEEIYFLLETFPTTSANVNQFVKSFFESTIDGYLSIETPTVPRNKIRSAMVRVLRGRHDGGYVHADYAHIMEVYNGKACDFNLAGVPSTQQRQIRMEHIEVAAKAVLYAAAFIAHTLELKDVYHAIVQALRDEGAFNAE